MPVLLPLECTDWSIVVKNYLSFQTACAPEQQHFTMLLLWGGIAQGVPCTVTISDLLFVRI
jgi:hypothetical protein